VRPMLVVLTLLATSGALAGCAAAGSGSAPTETEPPTYYTGGLGGASNDTGGLGGASRSTSQPSQNQYAPPAPTRGNAPPPSAGQPAPPPTTAGQPAGAFAAIDVENFAYRPATLNARIRQKVVWSNQDTTPHTVTADNLTWGRRIPPGSTYVRTFDQPGTFAYHCAIHPNMRGVLVVS